MSSVVYFFNHLLGDKTMKPFITKTTNAQGQTVGWAVYSFSNELLGEFSDFDQALSFSHSLTAGYVQSSPVEALPLGEYVKRKADSKTVYKRGEYDRSSKTYSLIDCSDINREIFVKRGTPLFFGFTY
jgi:hypothetical protein